MALSVSGKGEDYTYTTNNGTVTINKYTGLGGAVTIPSIIAGLPVTRIGSQAFYSCTNLISVTIPDSVTQIGMHAFFSCSSMTSATIGNGITTIGTYAFYSCTSLTNITIPNSATSIENYAFRACTSLTNATIGKSVTNIGTSVFLACSALIAITVDALNSFYSSVDGVLFNESQTTLIQCPGGKPGSYEVPETVTNILGYAFYSCTNLTGVEIASSVTSIGVFAFSSCTSLSSVTIPKSVTNIGYAPFSSCSSLSSIIVDAANSFYSSFEGVLFNKSKTVLMQYPAAKAGSYTVPSSVTNIGWAAFSSCAGLTYVTLLSSVSSIGSYAFYSCTRLSGVYFKGDVPGVGSSAFQRADNAAVYYLPGTKGWDATFGGRPTALWLPQIQSTDASFGVRSNRFAFNIGWASGQSVVVEAATNLANPVWSPLQTNTLSSDTVHFSDPDWTNYPGRFYRVRSP